MAWWETSCLVAVTEKKLNRCSIFFLSHYIIVYLAVRNAKIQNSESTPTPMIQAQAKKNTIYCMTVKSHANTMILYMDTLNFTPY